MFNSAETDECRLNRLIFLAPTHFYKQDYSSRRKKIWFISAAPRLFFFVPLPIHWSSSVRNSSRIKLVGGVPGGQQMLSNMPVACKPTVTKMMMKKKS